MAGLRARMPRRIDARAAAAAVVALTLVGLVPRLVHLDGTVLGDELSTLYIVRGNGLTDAIRTVHTDAEISPPLYFALAWLTTQLGAAADLVRLPALIAGVASIPLTYAVGRRAIGRRAGLIAAAAMALNPFMVFYATDGRAYTVAIALLLGTTLTMLLAVQSGHRRWWVAYAALTSLCMYTHYTTAFVLGSQLLWLLWAHPEARRSAVAANVGAAVAFLPWVPSLREDLSSPTIDILSDLQGDGFAVKRDAVENWAFGYPFNTPEQIPGSLAIAIGTIALGVAALVALARWLSRRRAATTASLSVAGPRASSAPAEPRGTALVLLLFLATPVAEVALLLLGGSDLLGARNLNTATGGFALSIGAIAVAAGPAIGSVCAATVLAVFAFGTAQSLASRTSTIDFKSAAEFIDANAGPDDVVVDMLSPVISPVPLTSLDAYLPQDRTEFRVYLPQGPPPFLTLPPPPRPILADAFAAARGKRLFLVAADGTVTANAEGRLSLRVPPVNPSVGDVKKFVLPRAASLAERRSYPGLGPVVVYEIDLSGSRILAASVHRAPRHRALATSMSVSSSAPRLRSGSRRPSRR